MTWLHSENNGEAVLLSLHIQPGAKKTAVVGLHGEALKIRLAAPPVDGKANQALVEFLAASLMVTKSRIDLVSGVSSRTKRIRITGVTAAAVRRSLLGS